LFYVLLHVRFLPKPYAYIVMHKLVGSKHKSVVFVVLMLE
jgi:hypothetical protein